MRGSERAPKVQNFPTTRSIDSKVEEMPRIQESNQEFKKLMVKMIKELKKN